MKTFMLKRLAVFACLLFLLSTHTNAQNVPYHDIALQNLGGFVKVVPSALITVCAGSHNEIPCSPPATIFKANGTQQANPFNADANGNFTFYATPATSYTITITGTSVIGYSLPFTAPVITPVTTAVCGLNTQIQYNDSATCGADANLTWNKVTGSFNAVGSGGTSSSLIDVIAGNVNGVLVTDTQTVVEANIPGSTVSLFGIGDVKIWSTGGKVKLGNPGTVSGQLTYVGKTSGSAEIGVADVAGTPCAILFPSTTGTSGQSLTTNGACPQQLSWATPTAGATSVGLSLPVQFGVTGSPVTSSGVLTGTWQNQYPNTVFGGPSQNSLGGIFDGTIVGTASATTSIPLTLKPNTTTDWAFFLVESQHIAQPGSVTMTGSGTWTNVLDNGGVGALFQQVLTSSASLTATANEVNPTNWAASMFFLTSTGAPTVIQKRSASGAISNGTSVTFLGATVAGRAILVTLDGIPPSANTIIASVVDDQGNTYTPVAYSQNGSLAVVMAWVASNIVGATTDKITFQTTSGSLTGAVLEIHELGNIAAQVGQPTFQSLSPAHVRQFMQAATTTTTTCPTAIAAGSTCTYTLTWPVPWPDATYGATCMGTSPVQFPVIQGVVNTTTTTTVTVENGTANQAQISGYTDMRCIGMSTHP